MSEMVLSVSGYVVGCLVGWFGWGGDISGGS